MFTQMFPQQISSQMATKMLVFVSLQECYVAMNPQKEEQAAKKKINKNLGHFRSNSEMLLQFYALLRYFA